MTDWLLLNSEHIQDFGSEEVSRFNTRLTHTNEAISHINYDILIQLGNLIITIKATRLSSNGFGGQDPIVSFCCSKVMLTRNWNGAMVQWNSDVIYKESQPRPSLPVVVMVQFSNHKGSTQGELWSNNSDNFKLQDYRQDGLTSTVRENTFGNYNS